MGKLGTMLQIGRTFGAREGMLRLSYELQRSSGLMSRKMRFSQGWEAWELKHIAPASSAGEMLSARREGTRPFFFTDARTMAQKIKRTIEPEGEALVLAQAEGILKGNLPFFGDLTFACGFPPRWFHNPATGQSVSPHQPWHRMRFASPVYGDLKFILEPSRFLFVYSLVRAYALSGDERFPGAFWNSVEDWARHSPPMDGPLWICGQECSLRIVAWSFALRAFIHSPSATNERVALLIPMIAAHAFRITQTLGYARSQRSNHLIAEAVGLWTAGTLYPELIRASAWQELGARLLHESVLDQIAPEGVSHQHSFNYQRMILHLLLWGLRLSELCDAPLPQAVRERAQSALDFLRTWVDPVSGLTPNFGANDGSLIFPLALSSYRDFRPFIQLGAAVLHDESLPAGVWDEAALWFGAQPMPCKRAAQESPPSAGTGYFRLGNETSWALIRAGGYLRRPFQADQLHVDLWWNGVNLARDAGTYLYNGEPPWNNGLAATAVHNTVMVDQTDQMRRAGRFLWLDWAQARGRLFSSSSDKNIDSFEGEHDGYGKLGIKHRRQVRWLRGAGWIIVDDLEGIGEHNVRLHWLLADLPYQVSNSGFQVATGITNSKVCWEVFCSAPGQAAVIRAGKLQNISPGKTGHSFTDADLSLLGWESPTYGELRPAISLIFQSRALLPVRLVTAVLTGDQSNLRVSADEIVVLRDRVLSGDRSVPDIRINRSPKRECFGNAESPDLCGSRI